jgi:hypothetical protein
MGNSAAEIPVFFHANAFGDLAHSVSSIIEENQSVIV